MATRKDTAQANREEKKLKEEEEKTEVVFVVLDGKIEQRKVQPGIQDTKYIEIIDGLELDEELVSAPYSVITKKLNHEDLVKVVDKLFEDKAKK